MKRTLRTFSFLMAVICLFAFSLFEPIYAITEQKAADKQTSEAIAELNDIWDESEKGSSLAYSPIVGELTDQRSEDTKRLRRADGAIELVMYSTPVHYEADGKWKNIDNTLISKTNEKDVKTYENLASDFKVRFGAEENVITVEYKGETLTFRQIFDEGDRITKASVIEKETKRDGLTDAEKDEHWRSPAELSSAIVYSQESIRGEKYPDVEYRLNGKSLSEFITLNERPLAAAVYKYRVESSLKPLLDGNSVRFVNKSGDTVLSFSAPYMTDAKGEECYDFKVSIEEADQGYVYTMIPSEEWLNAEERAYPVVIDPDVKPDYSGTITDTVISEVNPSTHYNPNVDRIKIAGSPKYRSLIKMNTLHPLSAGDVILQATLALSRYDANTNYGKEIDAYRVFRPWNENNVTWNNFYANSNAVDTSRVESFVMSTVYNDKNYLDITDLVKRWYAGAYTAEYTAMGVPEQYGIILQLADGLSNGYTEYRSAEYNNTYTISPYFSIVYINSTGLESRFSYSSQSVGRAGTGSVNLYSGNLTFSVSDAEIINGALPISVTHTYNTNDKNKDIGYGYGWRLNYAQYIEAVALKDNNTTATYYEYIDGDGTRHYYKKETSTKYVNELDKDSVLTINRSSGILTITDKGGNKLVFTGGSFNHDNDSNTQKEFLGHLTSVEDANGNKTLITYDTASVNGSVFRNMRITSITEKLAGSSAGQSITLSYTGNRLTRMTAPNGLDQTFGYNSSGDLTSIGYTDGKSVAYAYNAHRLTKATNIDNYNINYEYNTSDRVTKATEKAGATAGNYLNYDYGWNVTAVTDKQSRDTVYQFNNAGQAVSIRNAEGQAVFAAYNKGEREITQLAAVSKLQNTVVNLLKNHGFDIGTGGAGWTLGGSALFYGGYPHTGQNSVKLAANSYVEQSVAVQSGKTYTFSAYFTGAAGGYVQVLNGSTAIATSDTVETYGATGVDWARGAATFTVPSGVSSVKVRIAKTNVNTSYTYADSAQLEAGETPSRYNMIVNSDFANGLNHYTQNEVGSSQDFAVIVQDTDPGHPSGLSSSAVKITGKATTSRHIYQTIEVRGGKKGDTYSFGGWCKSDSAPLTQQYDFVNNTVREYGLKCLKVQFYNGSALVNQVNAYFAADTTDWQFTSSSAVAANPYTKVRLIVCFDYTRNTAHFDGLQLYREQFSQSYSYDANGNLKGCTSLIGQEPTLTYDSNNNVTSSKDARGNTTNYTYNTSGNVHLLKTATTPENTKTEYTYDTKGNVTQTKVSDKNNSSLYMTASTTYDSASALATAVTDARGNSVTYGYNSATRQQTSITDAKGNQSTYSYGNAASMLRLASLSSAGTGTVNYTYDQYGKLTRIARSTTNYNFTYDSWGRQLATKVGNTALSTNAYDQYGRLSSITYGNGFKSEYEYDNLDRTSKIYERANASASQQLAYEFVYDGEGNLYELRNHKTNRAVFFEYDHAGRCMASTEKRFTVTGGKPSYTDTVSGYKYEYDANNNLTKLTCSVNNTTWATTYTYDKDNRPTTATLHNGKQIVDTYDKLGRITKRRIALSANYDTDITYTAGANGSKTALVATYKNGNDAAYTYAYDANGNITSITKGSQNFTYTYDAANQLVRENLYYGANDPNNATYTYEYDEWGNILNKKKYAYTTGNLGSVIETISYGYGNTEWGDQLTSYNGQSITYDSMGNMTSCGYISYTWDGKQLVDICLLPIEVHISYSYNEDGLRVGKRVSWSSLGVERNTEYYYNGSVLIGMKTGNTVQRFSYDAQGKVVSVNYNGTEYYYLRNAQGDIVKLIDGSGNTVVEYTYDSWGKILSVTGSLATPLGENQPFRYRGYVYDSDTNLYYLQSRYYNPSLGRFISSDVYLSTGQGVLGHNSYAYCLNNPVNMVDNCGTEAEELMEVWGATMWWLTLVDGPIPAGDVIYAGGLAVLGLTLIFAGPATTEVEPIAIPQSEPITKPKLDSKEETKTKPDERIVKKPAPRKHFNSKKKAKEAAKKAGRGKPPIQHHNDPHGPHYHPNVPKSNPHYHDHYFYPW